MGTLLILAGLAGLLFGLTNLAHPLGRLRVTTRQRGAAIVGASFVIALIGGAVTPAVEAPDASKVVSPTTTISTTSASDAQATTSAGGPIATTVPLPDFPEADILLAPPNAGLSGDPTASPPAGAELVTVNSITDGDTIRVTLGSGAVDTVRLIGVNSPELRECFADEATLILSSLTPVGSQIGMTTDTSSRDQYDRLLRYLWVGDMSVNEELVRRGAAISRRYPPDTAMASRFENAQFEAQEGELGLWEPDACGPDAGTQIIVVSIEADAPGDDNDNLNAEYVRIKNNGDLAVDMTGWVLKDESASHRFDFPSGFVLGTGATLQVHTGCDVDTETSLYWCSSGAVWNNDGDTAFILDHNGNIVHSLPYLPVTTTTSNTSTTTVAAATATSQECHPSYTGACVPIVSDVDCLGGSGDGPYYVGRVTVIGPDVYDLDRDRDGIGCE